MWQAAGQVPRVPRRGGSGRRGVEGTGGAGGADEEGEEGQDDAAEKETHGRLKSQFKDAGQGLAKPSRTCCRARLHGKQRSGTHTVSCGGARSRRLHFAGRLCHARVRAAAADAWRDSLCTSGSSPESSQDRRIPHCS